MDEIVFAPTTGLANFDDLFASTNPFRITILVSDAPIVGGPETNLNAKSPLDLQITIGANIHQIPIDIASTIRTKNGGVVHWKTTVSNESGRFKFFRHAPAVFEDPELVRRKA